MKYLVIGLGTLGREIAKDLTRIGNEVIGVDIDPHHVDLVKNDIGGAIVLDATNKAALHTLPLNEMDAIIVTFGKNFGASVQTVALLKNLEAEHLIVRAISAIHETIIHAIGVSEIIRPEKEFSTMYAAQASLGGLFQYWYKITETEYIYKIKTPTAFVGQTIGNVNFEENFDIHPVAIERPYKRKNLIGLTVMDQKVISRLNPDLLIEADDTLILFGKIDQLKKIASL